LGKIGYGSYDWLFLSSQTLPHEDPSGIGMRTLWVCMLTNRGDDNYDNDNDNDEHSNTMPYTAPKIYILIALKLSIVSFWVMMPFSG
jgi:hypothetical protein